MTWSTVRLGDVADIQLGKMLSPKARSGAAPAPYLRNVNVQWGYIDLSDLLAMDFDDDDRRKFALYRGDLLVCEGGEPGRCAVLTSDLNGIFFQKALMRVRPNLALVEPRFLQQFMQYAATRGVFADGGNQATIAHFPAVRLNALQIPLPPLPEQIRIADILDIANAVRRKRKDAIALTEELRHSVFLDMFGDPVVNPKGWGIATLGELVDDLRYGTSERCDANQSNGALPVLRIPNVAHGSIDWTDLKFANLPSSEVGRLMLRRGDLLFVRSNGNPSLIGGCAVYDDDRPSLYASYLIRARPRSGLSMSKYLQGAFSSSSYRGVLTKLARTTAGNYNISAESLRQLRVPCPPQGILDRYRDIDDRLRRQRVFLDCASVESDVLFDAMMHRAFQKEL